MQKILLIRLSAIGDVINTLPALYALRKHLPDAFIGYVVEDKAKDVIAGHPYISRVFVYPRRRWVKYLQNPIFFLKAVSEIISYIIKLRRENFEISIDFQGNLKGAIHSFLSGARTRIGFSKGYCYEYNYFFSNVRVTPPDGRIHRVEKFLSLLQPLGIKSSEVVYRLPQLEESKSRVMKFLKDNKLNPLNYFIIHAGTSRFGITKRWPVENYISLARMLKSHKIVVTWGPGEYSLALKIKRDAGDHVNVAMPTESLLDLAEFIKNSRLFISADTGPMHIAAACGTRCIALFGPKDPQVYGPYGMANKIIISPNGRMTDISVEEVYKEVLHALKI